MSKFKVIVLMKEIGKYDTFEEAFAKFFTLIKEKLATTEMPALQLWEMKTTSFIEHEVETRFLGDKSTIRCVLNFYAARDFAYDVGLLKDGELQKLEEPVSLELVNLAFLRFVLSQTTKRMKRMRRLIKEAAEAEGLIDDMGNPIDESEGEVTQ